MPPQNTHLKVVLEDLKAARNVEVQQLREELAQLGQQHDRSLMQQHQTHRAALEEQAAKAQERVQAADAKVTALATQLKAALGKVKALQEALAAAQEETAAARARLQGHSDTVAAIVQQHADELARATAGVGALQRSSDGLRQALEQAQEEVAARDAEVEALSSHLAETITHIGDMKQRMEELEQSFELVYARLLVAVEKGAVPPVRPAEIKVFGAGALALTKVVSISIPRVVRSQTPSGTTYFTYEIYITVGPEQWVVRRRYSQLLAFQREVKRQLPGAEAIPFPPKVAAPGTSQATGHSLS